jgi:hypothetical protein
VDDGGQVRVLQRRQPRRPDLDWADRALLAAMIAAGVPAGDDGCQGARAVRGDG